jgi:hypothetical protein
VFQQLTLQRTTHLVTAAYSSSPTFHFALDSQVIKLSLNSIITTV